MAGKGYIKLHRQIVEKGIYIQPPLYLRVFERLVIEANHKCEQIPYNRTTKLIKRGERLTSIRQIAEWVGWFERGIFRVPNPKTIAEILQWLIDKELIEIYNKGNSQETHYNVLNYCIYQSLDDAESNTQVTANGQVSKQQTDTNNNDNNVNNEKELNINPALRELLSKLKGLPGWKYDFDKDLQMVKTLLTEFPEIDIGEQLKKVGTYLLDKPFKTNSNQRLFLRNWITNAKKFNKGKSPQISQHQPGQSLKDKYKDIYV